MSLLKSIVKGVFCAVTAIMAGSSFADTGYSHLYEWLESDGTQVIDLGVKPESDTMVFLTFDLLNTKERRLFGAHDGTSGVLLGVSGNWRARPKFENTYTGASGAVGRPYTFRIQIATPYISNGGYQFENHTLSQRYGTMTTAPSDYTYYVFGSNKAGEIEGKAALRLYSVVIYASDWHVLHDFRPASKNGTLGLVDRVTGEFRGNIAEGANAFTVGGEVETGAGSLTIATDPKDMPIALQPAAGTVDTLTTGDTVPVSAPALPYATDDFTATCTGWTLYTWNADSGAWVEETDRENHSGFGTSFTYTHTGTATKLVWHYALTSPAAVAGTTYRYVWNVNGVDAEDAGASWTMPYYSVKAAIDAANAGDVILIGPGVYKLNGELTVNKSVTIRGAAGKEVTELNGQDFCRCMTISGSATPSPVVEELTFRKGKSASQKDGGGVAVGYGTLRRCIVTDNAAGGRGGGLAISGSGFVSQCSVSSNKETICWGGVGVVMTGNSILEHSIVFDNVNWKDGVAGAGGPGGGIDLQSNNPTVRNCTIYGNCGTTGGGIYNNVGNNAKIHDCIVWGNMTTSDTSEGAPNWYGTGNKITNVFSSVAWGVTVGDRKLFGNPDFKDAAHGDFRLKATSLCCDSAWGVATVEKDFLGNPRVRGAKMDIGALESDPNEKAIAMVTAVEGSLDSAVLSCTAKGTGFDIGEATCYWTFDGRVPTAGDHDAVGVSASHTYGLGTVSVALTVVIGDETFTDVQSDLSFVYPAHTYVRETNPNAAAPYASWETAATDIQSAIDAAGDGSVVHVTNGTYHVTADISVMKQLTVRSVEGWQATTVDAGNKSRCFYLGIDGAVVDGFTLTHGVTPSQQDGGGALVVAGRLRRCFVTDNAASGKGGGVNVNGSGIVSECIVCTNRSTSSWGGPGICMQGGTVEHSIVFDNFNLDKEGNPTSGGDGGGIFMFNGSPKVRNCTVYGNWAGLGGGIRNAAGNNGSVIDTIVWGNHVTGDSSAGAPNWNGDGTKMTNVFSTVQWGTVTVADPDKFLGDPGFIDAAHGDFHLKATSPCRDASWGRATVESDVYGAERVQGDGMDVGAVENDPDVSSVSITYEKTGDLDACTVDFTANANGFEIAGATCYWTFDGRTPTADDHDAEGQTAQNEYGNGTHSAALAVVYNGQTYEDALVDFLTVSPSKIYVVVENEHAQSPFDTWAKAATNVNDAVEVAAEKGTTIFVSNGVHHVSKAITVNKQLTLTSVNGPSVTAITTDGRDRVLNQTINNSTVAGFTLTGGNSQGNGNGGGVNISGGVLTNCVVCGNRTGGNGIGGGLAMGGSALVTGCVVSNNVIDVNWWGGGIHLNGGTIENSLVCGNGNSSSSVDFNGGGIAVYQRGTIRNCTVVGNSAGPNGTGGGIFWRDQAGAVLDTIVWGNTGAAGVADLGGTPPSQVTNVCSSVAVGVNTSKNSLVGDPLFQDAANGNYRLRVQSPCRNAAWGKPTTAVDLDGRRRVVGRHMDLGCYECNHSVGMLIFAR